MDKFARPYWVESLWTNLHAQNLCGELARADSHISGTVCTRSPCGELARADSHGFDGKLARADFMDLMESLHAQTSCEKLVRADSWTDILD